MITSIVLTGKYEIGINSHRKILLDDNELSLDKDIPFVRYRFEAYDESAFNFIAENIKRFDKSTHLIELKLDNNTSTLINYINNNIKNVAKFVYIDVTDTDVANEELSADVINQLMTVKDLNVDRYMLKDKSTTLDMIHTKQFMKQMKQMCGINTALIGVCSSPLSFGELACLTAVKARELMALYSPVADVALPSANHQCMNCCGCIRYIVVSEDKMAPAEGGRKKTTNSNKPKEPKSSDTSKPKTGKQPIVLGRFSL